MRRTARLIFALGVGLILLTGPSCATRPQPASAGTGIATVEVLDIGQGDAILVRSPEGKTALIDAGPHKELAAELLRRRGIKGLDLVVISHHHADHYGGMEEVIREFKPRAFLASSLGETTPHYLRLLELVRDRGIRAIEPTERARKIELGSVVLTVFPLAPEDRADENNNSIGIRLQHGDFSVLLTGDAEHAERRWWERTVPELCAGCTVLKLAHHGSHNGTDEAWLELVKPELAIASVGKGNDYGHPSPQTLALLAGLDIPLLRTDRDGTVVIRSDGEHWSVVSHRIASRGPPREKAGPRTKHAKRSMPATGRINVNTATQAELEGLPGIGPVIAKRIVEGRPYRSVEDLNRVEEIGKKRLDEIRPLVTAE